MARFTSSMLRDWNSKGESRRDAQAKTAGARDRRATKSLNKHITDSKGVDWDLLDVRDRKALTSSVFGISESGILLAPVTLKQLVLFRFWHCSQGASSEV